MKLNKVLYSILFAALADFVLWDSSVNYGYGFLVAFLYLAGIILIVINNSFAFKSRIGLTSLIVSGVTFFALLENVSFLSVGLAWLNLIILSVVRMKDLDAGRLIEKVISTLKAMMVFRFWGIAKKNVQFNSKLLVVKKAILPFIFATIFFSLFSVINPLFTKLFQHILDFIVAWLSPLRISLFLFMTSVGFVLIRNRLKNKPSIFDFKSDVPSSSEFLSYRSICVSLVIFNVIFYAHVVTELYSIFFTATMVVSVAKQAVGAAHVLLIVTLLAIVFISLTSPYDKKTEKTSIMQFLVIIWLIQNFILMLLGIKYLGIYVGQYGLTYWRFSGVLWFGLIAFGLFLTGIKIFCKKSINWLVNCNAISVYVTLLVCCFINIPAFIMEYNINHKMFFYCDVAYRTYGEDVIPALIEGNECTSILEPEMSKFKNLYSNSYRFWTYRRYRTTKAIKRIK